MRKRLIRNKKMRYATVSVALTVMIIVVAVLANTVMVTLTQRYGWYTPLYGAETYDVTEDCYELLEDAFASCAEEDGSYPDVEIIFCDLPEELESEDSYNYYLYATAKEIAAKFDNVKLSCYDIWTDPTKVKQYTTSTNPLTGEVMTTALNSGSVIVTGEGYHRVYDWSSFFVYEDEEASSPWAYNGEKKLASAILRAVDSEEHIACVLNNHGETFYDYELLTLLDDAGYTVVYMDLYNEELPENCELIVSYNPNTDLIADGLSAVSEIEILDAFLAEDGHSFIVFLENGTPDLPNFERYLNEWGVSTDYYTNASGASYRYMIQDSAGSLTSDGYTVYGTAVSEAFDEDLVVFKDATSLSPASEGYIADGMSYRSVDGTRTMTPLYQSSESTLAWANGNAVDGGALSLMTLTKQDNGTGGSSGVCVVGSTDFSAAAFLQSAVYGNGDLMMKLFEDMGKELTPKGLTLKPFSSYDISIITTSQMLNWTVALAVTPAVLVIVAAVIVFAKRRRG
ncbi:MAG: Gldg family protein [Clostridia bacterium]|nr:Gldg family protein [Clostridia bacterium]